MWQHMYDAPAPTLRDPSPSPDDVAITEAIVKAGNLLDIQLLDHLIIGQGRFISLNRRGLGFSEN